jgi:hypothetical protein
VSHLRSSTQQVGEQLRRGDHHEETIQQEGGKSMQETSQRGGWLTKSDLPDEASLMRRDTEEVEVGK